MTIEEVEQLRYQEINDGLRFPKLKTENRDINKLFSIQAEIYYIINKNNFLSKLINKARLRKMGVKISGEGRKNNPCIVECEFGKGKVFNVNDIFKSRKCPFKVGACFSNSFNMICEMKNLPKVKDCNCVSGICLTRRDNRNRSILHSVVEINDMVIDVNLKMVISKDLYYNLFMFEELARISGDEAEEMLNILKIDEVKQISKQFNLQTYHMVFAFDDMKDFLTNKKRRNGYEAFQELNY